MAQRAIININGDLIPFSEDLDRIRTPGLGGSAVTWVPDADTICDQLKVTANGTYNAAEAGKYGYDYVVVSVPGSSVTGRDPDTGEEVEVHPDPETGEIVTTVLPTEIRVITPPAKTDYADGQTITKDGMVVKAYSATGAELQTVPIEEITINPTVAIYDASTDRSEYTGDGIDAIRIRSSVTPIDPEAVNLTYKLLGVPDGKSDTPGLDFYATTYGIKSYVASNNVFSAAVAIENSTTRIVNSGNGRFSLTVDAQFWEGAVPESSTDPTNKSIDDLEPAGTGSPQTITVSWPRPGDGAILETTFSINVTGGST